MTVTVTYTAESLKAIVSEFLRRADEAQAEADRTTFLGRRREARVRAETWRLAAALLDRTTIEPEMTTTSKRASARQILAATFGWDAREIGEYRYQPSRYAAPAVYAIGQKYFAVSATKPRHKDFGAEFGGGDWQENADQFWAARAGSKIWFVEIKEPKK